MSQLFHNTSNSSAFIGQNSEPQTAPPINITSMWEMLKGPPGKSFHPDHSLKLQSLETMPPAKEMLSQVRPLNSPTTRLAGVRTAVSEGKQP